MWPCDAGPATCNNCRCYTGCTWLKEQALLLLQLFLLLLCVPMQSGTRYIQVFNVPGRCYPVDIIHTMVDHQSDYSAAAIDVVLQIHLEQPPGERDEANKRCRGRGHGVCAYL